jgi:tetratricopeptide (TPR) repeat protein
MDPPAEDWIKQGLQLFDHDGSISTQNLDQATALWRQNIGESYEQHVRALPFITLLAPRLREKAEAEPFEIAIGDDVDCAKHWLALSRIGGGDCSVPLENYGDALQCSCEQHERKEDLLMARQLYKEALCDLQNPAPDQADLLVKLSEVLHILSIQDSRPDLIEERLTVLKHLLQLRAGDETKTRLVLSDLGDAYLAMSNVTGQEPPLIKAREFYEAALAILPGDTDLNSNIGVVLRQLGVLRRDREMLLQSESLHRAVLLIPEQPEDPNSVTECDGHCRVCKIVGRQNNLAAVLLLHHVYFGGYEERLDEAIEIFDAAIKLNLDTHHKVTRISLGLMFNYAVALHQRYLIQNDVASLDEAVRCGYACSRDTTHLTNL